MLVREWMTENVIYVTPDTSMLKASKLLKEHNIRRLPVVDASKKVVGILSDRDIKDASPSKATTLAMHELYYLLSEVKTKDMMTPNPVVVHPTDTVEKAAQLMEEKGFGSLPVVNEDGILEGIITDHDIFRIYCEITGSRYGGMQIALVLPDVSGSTIPFLDLLHAHGANMVTMLSAEYTVKENSRRVYVHLHPMERGQENKLIEAIKEKFHLLYWVRDKVYEA